MYTNIEYFKLERLIIFFFCKFKVFRYQSASSPLAVR